MELMVSVSHESVRAAFASRLAEAMGDAGFKPHGRAARLAERFGISKKGVSKWVNAESMPESTRIPELAEWLGVNGEWLLTGKGHKNNHSNVEQGPNLHGSVMVISWVQAGDYASVVDNYAPGDGEERVPVTCVVKQHTYALRVRGDSMEPVFPDGTILVVEPEFEALPGDYIIVRTAENEATFKQLIKDGSDYYLKPLNERYPIKPLPENAIICGVVRDALRRFR